MHSCITKQCALGLLLVFGFFPLDTTHYHQSFVRKSCWLLVSGLLCCVVAKLGWIPVWWTDSVFCINPSKCAFSRYLHLVSCNCPLLHCMVKSLFRYLVFVLNNNIFMNLKNFDPAHNLLKVQC